MNAVSFRRLAPTRQANSLRTGPDFWFTMEGQSMHPTIQRDDPVLVAPIDHYIGEGFYLVDMFGGHQDIWRVETNFNGGCILRKDQQHEDGRPVWPHYDLSKAEFSKVVCGKIVGAFNVFDKRLLPK